MIWRDEPPRVGEWDAPDILGWAFRGQLREAVGEPGERPIETTPRGIVVELLVAGDNGLPLWAQYGKHLFSFNGLRGQWCPVRVDEVVADTQPFDLERFFVHQAGRDREAEWHEYVATCDVFLYDSRLNLVLQQPLSTFPDFPREMPSVVLWKERHYRLGASFGGMGVQRSTIQFYEIIDEHDSVKSWDRVFVLVASHENCGRGSAESGCACRTTERRHECAKAGCGFCATTSAGYK